MKNRDLRITIRVSPEQWQVLTELTEALDTNYSLLIRTIIGDFINRNDDTLQEIIEKKLKEQNAYNQTVAEE